MTRAQQTLSVLLLVSSVCQGLHSSARIITNTCISSLSVQLYLVLYLGLVPLNLTVQKEIIPVVRPPPNQTTLVFLQAANTSSIPTSFPFTR
jgi:dolichyl-phosphate mannosyltransferase polypeptide 3